MIENMLNMIPKRKLVHTVIDYVWDKAEDYNENVIQKQKELAKEQADLKKQMVDILKKLSK